MPQMQPTKVMMLGGLGQFQPRLRTSFINPPRTTPIEPQNLLRQTMLGGLGQTGRMFMRLGQVAEDLVSGPTEDIVNQYLEQPLSPAGQTVPTPDAPILSAQGSVQLPGGGSVAVQVNEDGQPVDVISNGAGAGFSIPFGGRNYQIGAGAAIGYGLLSLLSGVVSGYHGFRRDRGSLGSTLGWFVLGSAFPVLTPAAAFFMKPGFAKPKGRR